MYLCIGTATTDSIRKLVALFTVPLVTIKFWSAHVSKLIRIYIYTLFSTQP